VPHDPIFSVFKVNMLHCPFEISISISFYVGLRSHFYVELIEVAGEHEVRGQIKLKFRDVTGSPIVVTRTLVSQQKVHENKR